VGVGFPFFFFAADPLFSITLTKQADEGGLRCIPLSWTFLSHPLQPTQWGLSNLHFPWVFCVLSVPLTSLVVVYPFLLWVLTPHPRTSHDQCLSPPAPVEYPFAGSLPPPVPTLLLSHTNSSGGPLPLKFDVTLSYIPPTLCSVFSCLRPV